MSPAVTPSSPPPASAGSSASGNRNVWIAFLLVCFLLTGMVGLFASYGPSIPLDRALHRIAAVDAASVNGSLDADALRLNLGKSADDVLTGPGDVQTRLARARAAIIADAEEDEAGVGSRTRLMIFVVTGLSAALGTGILLLVSRQKPN
jgi:hypothetical protein